MQMIGPPEWTTRGYPDPHVPPELVSLVRGGGQTEDERSLIKAADHFLSDLPRAPDRAVKVPDDVGQLAIVLGAARSYERIVNPDTSSERRQADQDRARYGVARVLTAVGMWADKRRLEDAVLRAELPKRSEQLQHRLSAFQETHLGFTRGVEAAIEHKLAADKLDASVLTAWCSVDGASRRLQTLRLPNFMLARPTDFYDVYVLVDSPSDCYRALQAIHRVGTPTPGGFQDLVVAPHPNGFSALTTRIRVLRHAERGKPIAETANVIVQTPLMHEIAWHGIAHPRCSSADREAPPFIRALLEGRTRRVGARPTMTVYSQGGRRLQPTAHQMEAGATVLDLAYKIHEVIGNEAVSAVVDGKLVASLGHVLDEGAIVVIHRNRDRRNVRNEDDLDLVTTPRARTRLKRGLNQRDPTMRGRLAVLQQLDDRNIPIRGRAELDRLVGAAVTNLKGDVAERSVEDIYREVGSTLADAHGSSVGVMNAHPEQHDGLVSAGSIAVAVADEVVKAGMERLLPTNTTIDQWRPTVVGGVSVSTRFAKLCGHCSPGTDDEIVGLAHRSHVTVHVLRCRHVRDRDVLAMRWIRVEGRVRSVINLSGADRPLLVIEVCQQVSRLGCGLEQLTAKADHYGKAQMALHIYADSSATVTELVSALGRVSGVGAVQRQSTRLESASSSSTTRPVVPREVVSRADVQPLTLHVRPTGRPIRHGAIHIPYDPQRPRFEGRFFGREQESADLLRSTERRTAPFIFICGPRKIGKSSLALRFSDHLPEHVRPHQIRVDLRSCKHGTSRDAFAKIVAEFRGAPFADSGVRDRDDPAHTLDALVRACDRRLLLILDEFGGPLESYRSKRLDGQFFSWIRTAMEDRDRRLTIMMAAPPDAEVLLRTVAHKDLDRIDTFPVGTLAPAAAREMFTEPLAEEGISVGKDAADALVAQCGGHPYYVISLLFKLAARLDANRRKWDVTRADIHGCVDDLLADHLPLSGWVLESGPTLVSRVCLDAIGRADGNPNAYVDVADIARAAQVDVGDAHSAMEQFMRHQIVDRSSGSSSAYRIAFPLVHEWIRRGGVRRDYFDRLEISERRCLFAVSDRSLPGSALSVPQIAEAARLDRASTTTALGTLVAANSIGESLGGRYVLEQPALRSWIEDYRRRENQRGHR